MYYFVYVYIYTLQISRVFHIKKQTRSYTNENLKQLKLEIRLLRFIYHMY